jgi:hypothetical protein
MAEHTKQLAAKEEELKQAAAKANELSASLQVR